MLQLVIKNIIIESQSQYESVFFLVDVKKNVTIESIIFVKLNSFISNKFKRMYCKN